MAIRERIDAFRAWVQATVKTWETHSYRQNWNLRQTDGYTDQQLVRDFYTQKWVYVMVSRNAQAVADQPFRVLRMVDESETGWRTRRLCRQEARDIRGGAGKLARKALVRDGETEEVTDPEHPLVRILEDANFRDNGFDLFELTATYLDLVGNAYWQMVPGVNGYPVQLLPMEAHWTRPVPSLDTPNNIISEYIYGRDRSVERSFGPEEVIHFRMPNPDNPYVGVSPLAAAVHESKLSAEFTTYALSQLENSGNLGGLIQGVNGQTTAKQLEDALNARQRGKAVGLWTAIGNKDVSVTPWKVDGKEISFMASDLQARQSIANIYGIPEALLTLDSAALAAAAEGIRHWQQMAISPRVQRIEDTLNAELTPLFREALGDPSLIIAFDPVVQEDRAAVTQIANQMFTSNIATRDEARSLLGMDPAETGGDLYHADVVAVDLEGGFGFGPSLVAPAQDAAESGEISPVAPKAEEAALNGAQIASLVDIAARVSAGELTREAGRAIASASFPGVPDEKINAIFDQLVEGGADTIGGDAVEDTAPKTARLTTIYGDIAKAFPVGCCHTKGDSNAERAEPRTPGERSSMADMEDNLEAWFGDMAAGARVTDSGGLALPVDARETFATAVEGPLGELFREGVTDGVDRISDTAEGAAALESNGLGGGTIPDVVDERLVEALNSYTTILADSVVGTMETSESVANILREGAASGATPTEMTDEISGVIADGSRASAERIVRSEGNYASQLGNDALWGEVGFWKEFQLSPDPCPQCKGFAKGPGKDPVPAGDPFAPVGTSYTGTDGKGYTVTFRGVIGGTVHPNCLCTAVPVPAPEGAE